MEPKTARRVDPQDRRQSPVTVRSIPSIGCSAHSIVLTLKGETRAADLKAGDKVITRDCGTAVVRRVTRQQTVCDAVLVKAGSLGHRRPPSDAILPATACLLVRDWRAQALFGRPQAVVQASRLCDGEFISPLPDHQMDTVTLEFDRPHILYIAGLELACEGTQ